MKKIYKYIKAFAVAAVVLLSFSCNNLLQDNVKISKQNPSECPVLKFNVTSIKEITENTERTVLPEVVELDDLTNFVVEGVDPWGSATNLGTYANLTALKNAEITLPYTKDGETWQFNLSAKKGGSNFYAHVEGIELSLKNEENPDVEVNFVLSFYDCDEGNGNFAFTIDYSEDASAGAVTKAEAVFEDRNNGEEIPELAQSFSGAQLADKKFTLVGENLPNGSYRAKITLYAGEKVASYWQDIIIIYSDLTSSKTQDIKLNKFVKFTYVLNDEGDESLVFEGEEYVKKTSKAKLPSPKRDTKVFGGWYKDEEFLTPFDFSTVTEATATVYAKWLDKNVSTTLTDAASTIAALDYGTAEDPVVVTVSGVYDEDEFTAMTSAVKSNENAFINLDINGVTGLTEIPSQWLRNCTTIIGVTLPNTITTIKDGAFRWCEALKSINLPSSLEEIGYASFQCCNSLTSINIPASVTTIEEYAFDSCVSLETITFQKNCSITVLEDYVFGSCPITSIEIPKSVITLKSAFAYCKKLENVTFETGTQLKEIIGCNYDCHAFQDCPIKSITIPASVETLEDAFGTHSYKTALESIVFEEGSKLKTIGHMAFKNCLFTEFTIPAGVVTIGSEAFSGCDNLEEITIPDSVTAFEGSCQFLRCQKLAAVTLGTGITEIPAAAFQECAALESISIPDNVTKIGAEALAYCPNLKTVTIGKGVTSIGNSVFKDSPVKTLKIDPNASIKSEGDILYNSDKTSILAFIDSSITSLNIIESVSSLSVDGIRALGDLQEITVASANTNYAAEDGVLYNKDKTELLVYPNAKIATSLTIPASLTALDVAYLSDKWIGQINVAQDNTLYSSKDGVLFSKDGKELILCPKAKPEESYAIPSGVTMIHPRAFYQCANLTEITVEDTLSDWYYYDKKSTPKKAFLSGYNNFDFVGHTQDCLMSSYYKYYIYVVNTADFVKDVVAISVYEDELKDVSDSSFTKVNQSGDDYNLVWFSLTTEENSTYKVSWIDNHDHEYTNLASLEFTRTDSMIYVYNEALSQISSCDDDASFEFTASGTKTYICVVNYQENNSCGCAFRVYKPNTTE